MIQRIRERNLPRHPILIHVTQVFVLNPIYGGRVRGTTDNYCITRTEIPLPAPENFQNSSYEGPYRHTRTASGNIDEPGKPEQDVCDLRECRDRRQQRRHDIIRQKAYHCKII
jgi:hypothetical protein